MEQGVISDHQTERVRMLLNRLHEETHDSAKFRKLVARLHTIEQTAPH